MAKTINPSLKAVDDEYREARKEWLAAKKRMAKAGDARSRAHALEEMMASNMAQQLRGLTDEQWAALRQHVDSPVPITETVINGAAVS